MVDFFATESVTTVPVKASDDLLQLSNPFADIFTQPPPASSVPNNQFNPVVNAWVINGNASGKSIRKFPFLLLLIKKKLNFRLSKRTTTTTVIDEWCICVRK